jgi:FkbM family methyltransferase
MSLKQWFKRSIEARVFEGINKHGYLHEKLDGIRNLIAEEGEKNRLLLRFLALPDTLFTFFYRGNEIKLYLPEGDTDDIQKQILMNRNFYELDFLEIIKNKTKGLTGTVVDVGANIGNHSIYFLKCCNFKNCISIEPNPQAFRTLQKNIEINGLSKLCAVIQKGASDSSCSLMELGISPAANLGATKLLNNNDGDVKTIAIDDLNLSEISLLKIDVEGMAAKVLDGAVSTLRTFKPIVFVELFPEEYKHGLRILTSAGYELDEKLPWDYYIFKVNKND